VVRSGAQAATVKADGRRALGVALIAFALPIAVMVAAALFYDEPIGTLSNDPVQIAGLPTRYGILANVSLALWGAAIGIALLGAAGAFRARRVREARWLASGAGLSLILLADDMLLLHDEVLESRGVPERVTLLGLAAVVVVLAVWNRTALLQTNLVLFGLTCGWFGIWAVSGGALFDGGAYLQDTAKLCGLCGWVAYFGLVAWTAMAPGDSRSGRVERRGGR